MIWCPLLARWLKVNTDGALTKNLTKAVYGVIFRDSNNVCHCCFAQNLNTESTFIGEISRAMKAIEIAIEKNWNNLWLETDSQLVLLAFRAEHMVPWFLRNIWFNCLQNVKNMNFLVSHIYIEGNTCAYMLTNFDLTLSPYVWFPYLPDFLRYEFVKNQLGLPNFRFM